MKIKIFVTGGTINNLEYNSEDKAPKNLKSLIPELLEKSRISVDYNYEALMMKDSRFVNDEDRKIISEKCKKCKENKIIISHGTMAMAITANFLGKSRIKKTIVLTGSAIPANKENSDALFNLGFAIASVQILKNGVYIAMNGKIFSWDNVRKNLKTGMFEEEK